MNVVEADVSREPLQDPGQFVEGTPFEGGLCVVPVRPPSPSKRLRTDAARRRATPRRRWPPSSPSIGSPGKARCRKWRRARWRAKEWRGWWRATIGAPACRPFWTEIDGGSGTASAGQRRTARWDCAKAGRRICVSGRTPDTPGRSVSTRPPCRACPDRPHWSDGRNVPIASDDRE